MAGVAAGVDVREKLLKRSTKKPVVGAVSTAGLGGGTRGEGIRTYASGTSELSDSVADLYIIGFFFQR